MNDVFKSYDLDPLWLERYNFATTTNCAEICDMRNYAIKISVVEFISYVKSLMKDSIQIYFNDNELTIINSTTLAQIRIGGTGNPFVVARKNFTVMLVGKTNDVKQIFDSLTNKYGEAKLATVTWWYEANDQATYQRVPLEPPLPTYDEYYPFIKEGVSGFYTRFLESSANILFISGEPGTGKTSFLRNMIYENSLNAMVTYEEELLSKDALFVNFITNDESNILIIEDADTMVGSRELENNKLIRRFLNVSDGLIKFSNKKIIFTANLGDFRKVDSALIRTGRCFGALKFRPLSFGEACRAAKVAAVPEPREQGDYTLAEIFAPQSIDLNEMTRIGF